MAFRGFCIWTLHMPHCKFQEDIKFQLKRLIINVVTFSWQICPYLPWVELITHPSSPVCVKCLCLWFGGKYSDSKHRLLSPWGTLIRCKWFDKSWHFLPRPSILLFCSHPCVTCFKWLSIAKSNRKYLCYVISVNIDLAIVSVWEHFC